jgi:gliding motility-associated-like protein
MTEPTGITNTLTTQTYIGGFNIKCKGDSSGVVYNSFSGGTPGFTFLWNGPGSYTSNAQSIYNVPAGSYSIAITDANGCVKTNTITLTEAPVALTATLGLNTIKCNGDTTGAISLTVAGGTSGYIFWWRGPNEFTSSQQNIINLTSGIYNLVVTDTNGCQISFDTTLAQPNAFTYTVASSAPLCYGVSNGSINVTLNGGTLPYTFNWSNGATTEDINGLNAGTYTLNLTDGNGCKDTTVVTLVQPQQALSIVKTIDNVKCYGDTTGAINLSIAGGSTPYVYSWSNGSSQEDQVGIKNGLYIVTITDVNGCKLIDSTHVIQPDSLALYLQSPVQFNGYNISLQGGNDGLINLTVNGGVTPYSYIWSNTMNTKDIANLIAGQYYVTVLDFNGCKASGGIVLTEPMILEMPTGYSPNNDGKNDFFVVHGIEAYPNNLITIYNRWGNVVYKKEGYKNEWDGVGNMGEVLPDATYFVVLEINGREIVKKGYVELRR